MGIKILGGVRINEGENRTGACLYESTSNIVFGPLFPDVETAESFLEWFGRQGHPQSYLLDHAMKVYSEEYLPEVGVRTRGDSDCDARNSN